MIGEIYKVEKELVEDALTGTVKKAYRQTHAAPLVRKFFAWVQKQFDSQGFLPSSPFTKAISYAHERREGLEVYLNDADVPIDTNHLERALRAIPMGKNNANSLIMRSSNFVQRFSPWPRVQSAPRLFA